MPINLRPKSTSSNVFDSSIGSRAHGRRHRRRRRHAVKYGWIFFSACFSFVAFVLSRLRKQMSNKLLLNSFSFHPIFHCIRSFSIARQFTRHLRSNSIILNHDHVINCPLYSKCVKLIISNSRFHWSRWPEQH